VSDNTDTMTTGDDAGPADTTSNEAAAAAPTGTAGSATDPAVSSTGSGDTPAAASPAGEAAPARVAPDFASVLGTEVPAPARLNDAAPHVRILSNGRYRTVVTGAGAGFSQCDSIAVTRWGGDRVSDNDGVHVYLRDLESGDVWSLGASPVGASVGGTFFVRTAPGTVTLGRRHEGIEAACEIAVAADADAEVRRFTLKNRVSAPRRIEVTVCAEIIVGHRGADLAHPAFAKLFVETAYDIASGALTARRRPRGSDELPIWAAAAFVGPGELQYETDRALFIGRGRTTASPAVLSASRTMLSATVGSVLDPVFALRRVVELPEGGEASLVWALAAGTSHDKVVGDVSTLTKQAASDDGMKAVVKAAAAAERARRRKHGLESDHAELAQELAGAMLYSHPALSVSDDARSRASLSANEFWSLGLPGDALFMLVPATHADTARVAAALAVAGYLAELGAGAGAAVLCEEPGCTREGCALRSAVEAATPRAGLAIAGQIGEAAAATLRTQAHWLVGESAPELADAPDAPKQRGPRPRAAKAEAPLAIKDKLLFDNGYGGFSADGREYVMRVGPAAAEIGEPSAVPTMPSAVPPMPWSNVVSNERFGFLVTESGAGYTWASNSRQNKLTPWSNDPVSDPHGEALYIRDNATGRFWSPQPGPAPSGSWCEVRHGMGWSRWLLRAEALEHEVTTFIGGEDPVRLTRIRISNRGSRERKLSLYSFARLVLGVQPAEASRFVVATRDAQTGVLLAQNPMSEDYRDQVAFSAVLKSPDSPGTSTTDRAEFVGRGGTMQTPRAVAEGASLGNDGNGRAQDPCFAFEIPVTLAPRGEAEIVIAIGQGADREAALALVERYRSEERQKESLEEVRTGWKDLTSALEVSTPSKSFDLMMNGWLLYQALSCRINGRSAYYQSGGAFGFRDQLQDSSALVYARPDLSRAQLLLHAAHQFPEGDVLHWWHPPHARGTRTRFSDDLNWLPYLTATYLGTTGDESVLDEKVSFVKARLLNEGEDETYLLPERTTETATVYEHCCLALDRSLTAGAHGLPLMGTGDWNDGMNRVGRLGRGESVWMAFFLVTILDLFTPVVEKRADWERLRRYRQYRQSLGSAIETSAWDGHWYRRAYYDDGAVLGSATSDECRIDAIAQSWSVLSGAASAERGRTAMNSLIEHLVDEEAGIIRLLWPPFDKTTHDPGYIKGYVPGIRENGGQYTHSAMWAIRALARLGDRERAMRYFEMVSPPARARDRAAADVYKVEPYVIAADVYGVEPHLGRGGWTWYTGSAAWMYRTGIESLLGLTIEDGRLLRIKPCIPDSWPGFRLKYRLPDRRTVYDIEVENPSGRAGSVVAASMGATEFPVDKAGARIVLRRDGKVHKIKVTLG
jgi:cellobiose phosphorylase